MMVLATIIVAITAVGLLSARELRPNASVLAPATGKRGTERMNKTFAWLRTWRAALALVAVAGLLSGSLYWTFGHHAAPGSGTKQMSAPPAGAAMALPDLTAKLAARLKSNPEDGQGWLLLAKSYVNLGHYAEAKEALQEALKRLPQDADARADWIDTMVMADNGAWNAEARKMLSAVLAANPEHRRALWLAGREALDRHAYKEAVGYFENLSALEGRESEEGRKVQAALEDARALAAGTKNPAAVNPGDLTAGRTAPVRP
jgi:cytochrome c-type biogenesis protein CcmH/NrfG